MINGNANDFITKRGDMMLNKLFKSIIDHDSSPVVICDKISYVAYMNASAISRYGKDLTGSNLSDCHSEKANKKIDDVLSWFKKSEENNIVHTFYNKTENKDVYMVALRDENKSLIGYYEKHEYRNKDNSLLYDMK